MNYFNSKQLLNEFEDRLEGVDLPTLYETDVTGLIREVRDLNLIQFDLLLPHSHGFGFGIASKSKSTAIRLNKLVKVYYKEKVLKKEIDDLEKILKIYGWHDVTKTISKTENNSSLGYLSNFTSDFEIMFDFE